MKKGDWQETEKETKKDKTRERGQKLEGRFEWKLAFECRGTKHN